MDCWHSATCATHPHWASARRSAQHRAVCTCASQMHGGRKKQYATVGQIGRVCGRLRLAGTPRRSREQHGQPLKASLPRLPSRLRLPRADSGYSSITLAMPRRCRPLLQHTQTLE
eukprot:4989110-Amphidinium_carterae.1